MIYGIWMSLKRSIYKYVRLKMLEIRPNCEHCGKALPNTSEEAMICSFECTYCKFCAINLFENVCPNCGGDFQIRPIRSKIMVRKYPPKIEPLHDPKSDSLINKMKSKYKHIIPSER